MVLHGLLQHVDSVETGWAIYVVASIAVEKKKLPNQQQLLLSSSKKETARETQSIRTQTPAKAVLLYVSLLKARRGD